MLKSIISSHLPKFWELKSGFGTPAKWPPRKAALPAKSLPWRSWNTYMWLNLIHEIVDEMAMIHTCLYLRSRMSIIQVFLTMTFFSVCNLIKNCILRTRALLFFRKLTTPKSYSEINWFVTYQLTWKSIGSPINLLDILQSSDCTFIP